MRVPPTQAESFHEERPTHPPKSRKLSGSSGPSSPVRSGSVTSSGKFYKLYPVLFLGGRTGCHRSDHTGAHVNVRHVCRRKPGNPPQSTDITAETLKQGFLPRIRLPLCRLECRNRLVRAFASHSFLFDLHFEPELLMFAVFFFLGSNCQVKLGKCSVMRDPLMNAPHMLPKVLVVGGEASTCQPSSLSPNPQP